MKHSAFALALFALASCGDPTVRNPAGDNGGTLVIAITQDPGTIFPPLVTSLQGKQIAEQIYDYLADVGPGLNTRGDRGFRPELTDGWRWSPDSLSVAFHINPHARWHDGAPVTAHDVVFTHQLNQSQALGGVMLGELRNIDSVTASDSLTAVFWFHERLPTQFVDAAAQLLILPAHQLESIAPQALRERPPPPIGTGRFRFRKWDLGTSVELVSDTSNYRGRAKLDRVVWMVHPDFTGAVTRLLSGDADLFDALRPENVRDVIRNPTLHIITTPGTDYGFLQFNLRDPADTARSHPLFGTRELRRAIAMSVDRASIIRNVFDTFAVVAIGPTIRIYPTTDTLIPQIPFDTVRASALLDSLGWRRPLPGAVRIRDGRRLKFNILVPSSSLTRIRIASLLQAQLARMGIEVGIETMDGAAQGARLASRKFDASLNAWHMGASPDGTRGGWTAAGLGPDGINYGSYVNPEFDRQLEVALRADSAHAKPAFSLAYATINGDVPGVWLYEPRTVIGVHQRFRTGAMRPDAWWFDLADWWIPSTRRIGRDRVPFSR